MLPASEDCIKILQNSGSLWPLGIGIAATRMTTQLPARVYSAVVAEDDLFSRRANLNKELRAIAFVDGP